MPWHDSLLTQREKSILKSEVKELNKNRFSQYQKRREGYEYRQETNTDIVSNGGLNSWKLGARALTRDLLKGMGRSRYNMVQKCVDSI
jgi:hypothetical protein